VVALVMIAAVVAGLLLAIPGLHGIGHALGQVGPEWIVLAVGLEVLSDAGYAFVMVLVLPRGPKPFAAQLGWAESAFGAAVSIGGVGALALGAWVLGAVGMPKSRIANRSAVAFLATSGVNVIVLGVTGLGVWLHLLSGPSGALLSLVPGLVGTTLALVFIVMPVVVKRSARVRKSPHRWARALTGLSDSVLDAEIVLRSTRWQTVGVWAYLLCDIAVLWVSLRGLGVHVPFAAVALAVPVVIGSIAFFLVKRQIPKLARARPDGDERAAEALSTRAEAPASEVEGSAPTQ
jgi:hypothetical protein